MKYMRLAYTNKFRVFLSQQSLFDHGYPLGISINMLKFKNSNKSAWLAQFFN